MTSYISQAVAFVARRNSRDQPCPGPSPSPSTSPLNIDISTRGPAVISFDSWPVRSEPAFLTCHILVSAQDDDVQVTSLKGTIIKRVEYKGPYTSRCDACRHVHHTLATESFLSATTTHARDDVAAYPLQAQLNADQPGTMDTSLLRVTYEVEVEAQYLIPGTSEPAISKTTKDLTVIRSRMTSEAAMQSSYRRCEPNIALTFSHPPVIHPDNCLATVTLADLIGRTKSGGALEGWKLKRVAVQLAEHIKVESPACMTHSTGNTATGEVGAVQKRTTTKRNSAVLFQEVLRGGWLSSYDTPDWSAEVDINCLGEDDEICQFVSDMALPDGTRITHELTVTCWLSGYTIKGEGGTLTPMKKERILRTTHHVVVSQRAGNGDEEADEGADADDEEAPPEYAAATDMPPEYEA